MDDKKPWLLKLPLKPISSRDTEKPTSKGKTVDDGNSIRANPPDVPDDAEECPLYHETLPEDTLGLALSGGGIRSSSFCLGILQALAGSDWLKRVDILSTVSGGGYIGSFLGRFFDTCHEPQQVSNALTNTQSREINWLRAHANYLSPKGVGDTVYNLASFWRNLLSVHLVLWVFFFAVFGAINVVGYFPYHWADTLFSLLEQLAPFTSTIETNMGFTSPWAAFAESLVWVTVLPLAIAYWIVSEDYYEELVLSFLFTALVIAIVVLLATLWPGALVVFAASVFWIFFAWRTIKKNEGHGNPRSRFRIALSRNYLTHYLGLWSMIVLAIVVLAIVDATGRYLASAYLLTLTEGSALWGVVGSLVSLVGMIPFLRGFAVYLVNAGSSNRGFLAKLRKIPFLATFSLFLLLGILPLLVVSFMSHVVFELGETWILGTVATSVAILISLLLGWASPLFEYSNPVRFVNRSGLLGIYSARLARVFLGAVNPRRYHHNDGKNIRHLIAGDDVPYNEYKPHDRGGPLHLINVAVNETVDVSSQRGIRDRKAENMVMGPAGVNVARNFHAIWTDQDQATCELNPIGDLSSAHPFLKNDRTPVAIENLNLREWTAISGAAISAAKGRETQIGRSILFTLTNLRLGYWWNSGIYSHERFRLPMRMDLAEQIRRMGYRLFSSQMLLLAELIGRFTGAWRRHWYLSDGGHFELTGAYELIRRRVPYMVVVDVGADKEYNGEVIGWLARLVRIDFGAEFREVDLDQISEVPSEVKEQLGSVEELLGSEGNPPHKNATLFQVQFPKSERTEKSWHGRSCCWMLYIRASVIDGEPVDVRNYKLENPDFPNEPTLDQFFDEPQWESYRKLGEHIGGRFFE